MGFLNMWKTRRAEKKQYKLIERLECEVHEYFSENSLIEMVEDFDHLRKKHNLKSYVLSYTAAPKDGRTAYLYKHVPDLISVYYGVQRAFVCYTSKEAFDRIEKTFLEEDDGEWIYERKL